MLRLPHLLLLVQIFAVAHLCSAFSFPSAVLGNLNRGRNDCCRGSASVFNAELPRGYQLARNPRRESHVELRNGALSLQASDNAALKSELLAAIRTFNSLQERDGKEAVDFGVKGGELDEGSRAPRNLAKGGGFYRISEDVGAAADKIFAIIDKLEAANPTPNPTEFFGTEEGAKCALHGEWKLLFTTAADATFSKNSSRGDAQASNVVDAVRGKVVNIIDFAGGADGKAPPLKRLRVRLQATVISPSKVQLQFRYVKATLSSFLGLPFPATLFLPVPGPTLTRILFFWRNKAPPVPFFEVLYIDPQLRIHRTGEDNVFVQGRPGWTEAWPSSESSSS